MPRMFVGAAERDLTVEMFGLTLPSPIFLAPIGVIGLCAQDGHGDLATARGGPYRSPDGGLHPDSRPHGRRGRRVR